ncbi:hypothetical protein [Aquipuribacter hungaricus]|uniref:Uncharacterized protein n=1 Tax=Aquipuribacter hungaricus TaxID=545624 RepID=A0ABV7WFT5_9MICO
MTTFAPTPVARHAARDTDTPPTRWWTPAVLPGGWTRLLLVAVAGIVALHVVVSLLATSVEDFPGLDPAVRLFDMDEERGLPAWFSTLLLAAVAQALWLLARQSARSGRARWVRHEQGLAVVFAYLSLDEMVSLHEQTITPLRRALDLEGILAFSWVLLFVPLALAVAVLSLGWLRSLPLQAVRLVVLAGALYVGGAAGVELAGAGLMDAGRVDTMAYQLTVVVEEVAEIAGALLMLSVVTWLRLRPEPLHD